MASAQARQAFLYGGSGARFDVFAAPCMKLGEHLIRVGQRFDAICIDGDFVTWNGPDRDFVAQAVEVGSRTTTAEG